MPLRSYHKPLDAAWLLCTTAKTSACDQKTSKVLLTLDYVKYSLELLFSIVNLSHGTSNAATTRLRPAPRHGIPLAPPPHHRGPSRAHGSSLPARGSSQHPHRFGRILAPKNSRLCRPRLSGGRWLHGSRQLGHRPGRRLQVRLHAAQCHPHQQSHGDVSSSAVSKAWHRHRPRSRASLPGALFLSHFPFSVGGL